MRDQEDEELYLAVGWCTLGHADAPVSCAAVHCHEVDGVAPDGERRGRSFCARDDAWNPKRQVGARDNAGGVCS